MGPLAKIHQEIVDVLKEKFTLDRVQLKHRLPVRPIRMLGLIGMDGEVYSTNKLLRVTCLRISPPVFMKVFSTYMCARVEYDLPAFLCEVVYMGKNIMVILDVHRTADVAELERDKPFYDTLMDIRAHYSDLLAFPLEAKGSLASFTDLDSRAACRLKITGAHEERALEMVKEYLDAYAEYVTRSLALEGDALATARENLERYLEKVEEEDPGVKGNKIFFGKKEGVARALDMFFGV